MRTRLGVIGVALAALVLVAAGCSDDDGSGVRTIEGDCPSSSASGSAAGSGSAADSGSASGACASSSGSATGLSEEDLGSGETDNPLVAEAVEEYTVYVDEQVADTVAKTTTFTDAVRAGDLEAAKAAFAPSRVGWESIEPIAGLVEEIDGAVDARVDDFEGPDDPTWTGWHRIEYILWDQNTTEGAAEFADQLDADLATLEAELPDLEITPLAVAKGASELIEEVSEGKITGEEDRYSHTDLWDFDANVDGSKKVIELLTPALEEADPDLLATINEQFDAVQQTLSTYETADGGFEEFGALTQADTDQLKADLAGLSESLAEVPGALGLS